MYRGFNIFIKSDCITSMTAAYLPPLRREVGKTPLWSARWLTVWHSVQASIDTWQDVVATQMNVNAPHWKTFWPSPITKVIAEITVCQQANNLFRLFKPCCLVPSNWWVQYYCKNYKTMIINLHHPILRLYHPQNKWKMNWKVASIVTRLMIIIKNNH